MFILSRRDALGALSFFALGACATVDKNPLSLEDIIRKHVRARGGVQALDRVSNLLIDLNIEEDGSTIQARYQANIEGYARIDIYSENTWVFSEGLDSQGAWVWPASALEAKPSKTEAAAHALANGADTHLFGLHRFSERGHRLRLMPRQVLDGVDYYVIECVYKSGQVSYFYIDPSTFLIVRKRDERAYHPDVDSTKVRIETRFSNFINVQGVVAAHRDDDFDLNKNTIVATHIVTRRVLNPQIEAASMGRSVKSPTKLV